MYGVLSEEIFLEKELFLSMSNDAWVSVYKSLEDICKTCKEKKDLLVSNNTKQETFQLRKWIKWNNYRLIRITSFKVTGRLETWEISVYMQAFQACSKKYNA